MFVNGKMKLMILLTTKATDVFPLRINNDSNKDKRVGKIYKSIHNPGYHLKAVSGLSKINPHK